MKNYTLGIDVGGTKVAYALFDAGGSIIDRTQHLTDAEAEGPGFSDTLISNIRAMMEKNELTFDTLEGVGVCMPSHILQDEGRVYMTSSIPGIKDFPMLQYLSDRLPTRIALVNDADAAALAEHRRGAGSGKRHMVYLVLGTGLGSGIVIDGKLFHGSYGFAGECGHMLATPDSGFMCGCENRGCFMSHASGKFIPALVRSALDRGAQSILTPKSADGASLLEAYNAGDTLAAEVIGGMAYYFAVCVFNMYQILNIDTYVFGGGLVSMGEPLLGRIRSEFDRFNHLPLPVYFKTAQLVNDAELIGAAEMIRSAVS